MFASNRSSSESTRTLLVFALPIILAVGGFVGFISLSFLPLSPSEELFDLSQQLEEARANSLSGDQVRTLDRAAANLAAAQHVIEHESGRSWQLRSYDRAHNLLWKAEALLEDARTSSPPPDSSQPVAAGS